MNSARRADIKIARTKGADMADTTTQNDAEAQADEQAATTQEVLVEEVSIDGMCGVY